MTPLPGNYSRKNVCVTQSDFLYEQCGISQRGKSLCLILFDFADHPERHLEMHTLAAVERLDLPTVGQTFRHPGNILGRLNYRKTYCNIAC
jgi:hypothetical protein